MYWGSMVEPSVHSMTEVLLFEPFEEAALLLATRLIGRASEVAAPLVLAELEDWGAEVTWLEYCP